ncbi:MAG TPA: adenylosuccinate lyase [Bdellovibrionota bacterium]|jgi:adenylosuccinate lyase
MIERYTLPEAAAIWSDKARYNTWLKVELAACKAMVKHKIMPEGMYRRLVSKAKVDVAKIQKNEELVKHDIIAFTMAIEEKAGADAQYFHYGLTSSDVLDTALALQLKEVGSLILVEMKTLAKALKQLALDTKKIPAVGRSHGIHAEPLSFGLRFLSHYAELQRNRERFERAIENVSVGMFSGAVGSYGTLPPGIEKTACEILGLVPEAVSTQVVPRDRHAEFFQALALLGTGIERMSVELRHLQRTEVGEVEEGFSHGQKGSSAMPHKKNPISAENLTGCARLLRGYAEAALENVPLWHERDISHSSVERVIGPDATILAHYMIVRARKLIEGLKVKKDRVKDNLQATRGLVYSGAVLLALVEAGLNRDAAYRLVQKHALEAWKGGASLKERLLKDAEVLQYLKRKGVEAVFHASRGLEHADHTYKEVFRRYPL